MARYRDENRFEFLCARRAFDETTCFGGPSYKYAWALACREIFLKAMDNDKSGDPRVLSCREKLATTMHYCRTQLHRILESDIAEYTRLKKLAKNRNRAFFAKAVTKALAAFAEHARLKKLAKKRDRAFFAKALAAWQNAVSLEKAEDDVNRFNEKFSAMMV